jgi:hypothetical protein
LVLMGAGRRAPRTRTIKGIAIEGNEKRGA